MTVTLYSRSTAVQRSRLEVLGTVTHLASRVRPYETFAMKCARIWLEPPIDYDLVRVFYLATGQPVGYVSFAWLAPDVSERLRTDTNFRLHPSEWTEGPELWVLDFVAPYGHALEIARALRTDPLLSGIDRIHFARTKSGAPGRRIERRLKTRASS